MHDKQNKGLPLKKNISGSLSNEGYCQSFFIIRIIDLHKERKKEI